MKYSENNKPLVCMMTQSSCYKGTSLMAPKGVLWHSTGANNPRLKRYVQPNDDAPDREEMLKLLGVNKYNNDWNHIELKAGLNAWIGALADGTITTVQTLPWDFRPWGCGSGAKGSCNYGWMQFEICEDDLSNQEYFEAVYKEACELTAYYCKMYDIDPLGTVTFNGVVVPTILCHADSHDLGLGSNHGDVLHWFKKYGKTMDDVRKDVAELLKPPAPPVVNNPVKKGDLVAIADDAVYYSGKSIPLWVKAKKWYVREVSGDRAVINESEDKENAINSPVNVKYLIPVEMQEKVEEKEEFKPYLVKVTANILNYRQGPGTSYKVKGTIKKNEIYTIIEEENGWGKLKSGAGWISLKYTSKV